ncbi:MAG: DMT family transporter [Chthoniobacteraceae bacterium]
MTPHSARRSALIQIHIAVLLAGGTGLFGKLLDLSPMAITCGRTLVGSVALALVAIFLRVNLRLHGLRSSVLLALSGVALAAHWVTFFHSIQISTVAVGLLAFSTFPLMVTFLEPVFFRERLHRRDLIIAVIVTAGIVLVTPSFDVSNRLTQGVLWGLLSALLCALVSLLSRFAAGVYPATAAAFYQQAITALCTLPFVLSDWPVFTLRDGLLLVLLGVVFTALLQVLIITSLRHVRAQVASVMFGLEPLYGIVLAWLLLAEVPAMRTLLGGLLICSAVVWISLTHSSHAPES